MPTTPPLAELKQQLAQLDALVADGTLRGDEARRARDDLERRIVQAVTGAAPAAAEAAPPRPSRALVAGVAAFVVAVAGIGYGALGNRAGWSVGPGAPGGDATAAADGAPAVDPAQIEAMVAKLAERLKAQPDDAEGWTMLARSYTAQGKHDQAVAAYKRVVELRPRDAQALADYADGLAAANRRSLDGEPEKLVMQALALDPNNLKALALAGTIAFNYADYAGAVAYWERAQKGADPSSELVRALGGAIAEARQRGGLPAAAAAGPVSPAASGTAVAAARVAGRVSLKPALQGQVRPDDTVFIFARPAAGARMPLAVLRRKVSDLPLDFSLDDSLAMSPAARLSSSPQVVVGARISRSGNPMPSAGDFEATSAPVALGTAGLQLEIGEPVR